MRFVLVLIILLIVLAECTAQAYTNRFHHEGRLHLYLAAVGFYAIVVYLLSRAHGYTSLSTANALWSGLSVLAVAMTGLIFFRQGICFKQWIALILIAVSVGYLIYTGSEPTP